MTETTTPGTTAGLPSSESLPAPIAALREAGVAIWLDDLSRELIRGGELQRLVTDLGVVGVTTNPTIFASALSKGEAYDDQLRELAAQGVTPEEAIFTITTDDVREACDVLAPVHAATGGQDGRVSIEVDPGAARDTERTIEIARRLWSTVDRPNLYIKIPATVEGLPAISAVLAEGISVNVTLIFSLERYAAVLDAYQSGLEGAQAAGRDLSGIASVASFFVSRVDAAVDKKLDEIGTDEAKAVRGGTAIANARLAYRLFQEVSSQDRWQALLAAGATPQRPLWASTGVKDKAYPDTRYVDELVTSGVVNTMPRGTLEAVADHGTITGDTVTGAYQAAEQQAAALEPLGIDLAEVTVALEDEGLTKFDASWAELVETVTEGLQRAAQGKDGLAGETDEAP